MHSAGSIFLRDATAIDGMHQIQFMKRNPVCAHLWFGIGTRPLVSD
jgi:hypothetical protein